MNLQQKTTPRRGVFLADFGLFFGGKIEEMQEFQGFRARHAVACFQKENFQMCWLSENDLFAFTIEQMFGIMYS
ncbi:MAG: hypothetical protein IJ418_23855 [Clostridia bacterium]|nr:hypothetical protein [Clostridia bacterium]